MKKITVSAPAKLMLFGEHAVLYGKPCLVTAVNQRIRAAVEILDSPEFQLEAPDVKINGYIKAMHELGKRNIPKTAKFIEIAVKNFLDKISLPPLIGIKITTTSDFSPKFGFGSSSAVTVAVLKALFELSEIKYSPKEIFTLAHKTVLDIQGTGSGFDIAASQYGGTLYFVTGGKTISPLAIPHLPLIVSYSGIKADTATFINAVKEKSKKEPRVVENIYSKIENIVEKAKSAIIARDLKKIGSLMNQNQKYLQMLGVSNEKLDTMINSAIKAGAYGAKISGAGGGDCIIAIAPQRKREAIKSALIKAGGKIITVKTNAEGVRIEN